MLDNEEEDGRGQVLEKRVRKEMMSSHKFRSTCVTHATVWMIWTEIGVGMLGATSVNWLVSRDYFAEPFSTGGRMVGRKEERGC